MGIIRQRIDVSELTAIQKDRMFFLMNNHYGNTLRNNFEYDLQEKDWVLMLLNEETMEMVGFSSQMLIKTMFNGKEIGVLFSGDTIIDKEHWGSMALSISFGELMIDLIDANKDMEIYWMLVSKGIRTYKYLQIFFMEYYPNYKINTPKEISELIDYLGFLRYPDSYDKTKGIVKAAQESQYLKEGYQADAKPKKQHEVFFTQINPGYLNGDELICIAKLSLDNLNPFMRRVLKIS